MGNTNISYLDKVWSPISGCGGVGCKCRDHCWARDMVRRFPAIHGLVIDPYYDQHTKKLIMLPEPFNEPIFHPDRLDEPLHWRKPQRVGVAFCGDWMDEQVPESWLDQIMGVMNHPHCERHQFFTLTKQARNLRERLAPFGELQANIWNGLSICDQEDLDSKADDFFRVPGKKWLSIEPMLTSIFLWSEWENSIHYRSTKPDWVVIGCESGAKRRHCAKTWMIDVVRQCKEAGVKVYCKQIDMGKRVSHDPEYWPEELRRRETL